MADPATVSSMLPRMSAAELEALQSLIAEELARRRAPSAEPGAASPPVLQLTKQQISRYSRQLLLPCFGPAAQLKLLSASALVVGAGGLGSPVLAYLAGAGVGRIGVIDDDYVETSNLHRQVASPSSSGSADGRGFDRG